MPTTWTAWMPWIVVGLILLSVLRDLATGRTRMRGLGVRERAGQPGRYWAMVGLKVLLAALILVIAVREVREHLRLD